MRRRQLASASVATVSKEETSWTEDNVFFSGNIRKSGNSFVITIPVELVRRFALVEGQKVNIVGMSRKTDNFEGSIGIRLGDFRVLEKAYGLEIKLKDGIRIEEDNILNKIVEENAATAILYDEYENDNTVVKILFGNIRNERIRPRAKEEIVKIAEEVKSEVERSGAKVEKLEVFEEETEWRQIDPNLIAKNPHLESERIEWEWKI